MCKKCKDYTKAYTSIVISKLRHCLMLRLLFRHGLQCELDDSNGCDAVYNSFHAIQLLSSRDLADIAWQGE